MVYHHHLPDLNPMTILFKTTVEKFLDAKKNYSPKCLNQNQRCELQFGRRRFAKVSNRFYSFYIFIAAKTLDFYMLSNIKMDTRKKKIRTVIFVNAFICEIL